MDDDELPGDGRRTADDIFAKSLQTARRHQGLTQSDVLELMVNRGFDWNQTTVSKVERGDRRVTVGEAVALAQILGSTVESLSALDRTSLDYKMSVIQSNALFSLVAANNAVGDARQLADAVRVLRASLGELRPDATRPRIQGATGPLEPTEFYAPVTRLETAATQFIDAVGQLTRDEQGVIVLRYLKYDPDKLM